MTLRQAAVSGVKWTTFSTIVTVLIQILQIIILARLLKPEDFGLMAMVTVAIGFAQAYADLGISSAIIQRQDATAEQLSSLYWLNIAAGIVLFFLIWIISPVIALWFREPRLELLVATVGFTFLVAPVGVQFQMLLQKNLQFDLLAKQDVAAAVVGFVVACLCAVSGYGVWSFVWGQLSSSALKAILSVYSGWSRWPPRFHFMFRDLHEYISFGLYQMGERTINYFNSKLDQLLIGYLLGPVMLGYYSFGFNLVMQPIARINPILTTVAFPLFARVQHDNTRLGSGYFSLQKVVSMVNFPILTGLFAIAPALIPLVFGDQWYPATALVQVLAFVALIRSTGNPVGSLLLAKGRADLGFKWNTLLLCTQIPGVYLGIRCGGILGVCVALLFLQTIYFCLSYPFLVRRVLGSCLTQYAMSMIPAFALSGAMIIPVLLLPVGLRQVPPGWMVSIQVTCGAIVYGVLSLIFQREWLTQMKNMILLR